MWPEIETPVVSLVEVDDDTAELMLNVADAIGVRLRRFSSALSFLQQFNSAEPGCVFADFNMPNRGGWELVDVINAEAPGLQIVFFASAIEIATVVNLMKAGVSDIITQPFEKQALELCIRRAIDLDVQNKRAYSAHASARRYYTMLTPREREVFQLVVSGLPSKGIAQVLDRSQKTVEVHRTSIMKKMAAKSVVDLVRLGIELRVLDSDISEGTAPNSETQYGHRRPVHSAGNRPMGL